MHRKARINAAGAVHHVIGGGINRQAIFSDKKDYQNFLARLRDLLGPRLAMLLEEERLL